MKFRPAMFLCLLAFPPFLSAAAIAGCSADVDSERFTNLAFGITEAAADCFGGASASAEFSLFSDWNFLGGVARASVGGQGVSSASAFASLDSPLVVVGGPREGKLLFNVAGEELYNQFVDAAWAFSVCSRGYCSGAPEPVEFGPVVFDYGRGEPIDIRISAMADQCRDPSCVEDSQSKHASAIIFVSISGIKSLNDEWVPDAHVELIPEPRSLLLIGAGLFALGALRLRVTG